MQKKVGAQALGFTHKNTQGLKKNILKKYTDIK